MPISREQLEALRALGWTPDYNLVQGDNTNPSPNDLFEQKPYQFNNASNLLDAMRQQAGVDKAGLVNGNYNEPALASSKPNNILDLMRQKAGVPEQMEQLNPALKFKKLASILKQQ